MAKSNLLRILRDRYLLLEPRQAGGMTTVYQARDLQTDELVAVKRFDRDSHLPEIEQEAFRREVDALRNLSHPHVVKMFDYGEDEEGKFFVVLELMKHDLIREREEHGLAFAGWDDFAALVVQPLLSALAYAHSMDLAHRDVKPANVLVSHDGVIKLADFGISKLKRTLQPRITLNEFMSPPFSPPEPDKGNRTYARDVYSIGAICLWALSRVRVSDYSDIMPALQQFDAPLAIKNLIQQAVAEDPEKRQHSAALLEAEILKIQRERQQQWAEESRPRCSVAITKKVFDFVADDLGLDFENELRRFLKEREVRRFLEEDMNSDSTIERFIEKFGTFEQRTREANYCILGGTYRYHVVRNDRGGFESLKVVNVLKPEPHFLQMDRAKSAGAPLTFNLEARTGTISQDETIRVLEKALEEFEANRREEELREKETALFDSWLRVLEAKIQYERDQSKPFRFNAASIDGSFVTLAAEADLDGLEVGQGRIVQTAPGRFIRGEVWEIRENCVVLNCPGASLAGLPQSGQAILDLHALRIAVKRQRDAIDLIRLGTCVNSQLKRLLLDPAGSREPLKDTELTEKVAGMMDESKRQALKAAIGTEDILLVEGPPGTGKTRFIVGLILEQLAINPHSRILLSSQTHVAIDNALEKLAEHISPTGILRIAQAESRAVSDSSLPFLLTKQLRSWREDITLRSARGLQEWARRQGLIPADIQLGALVRQIATLRQRIETVRAQIVKSEQRLISNEGDELQMQAVDSELELESRAIELQELRDQLDSDKKQLERAEKEFITSSNAAKDLVQVSIAEQMEWADALLGDSPAATTAERIMKLQSEWVDRFGTASGFLKPLLEKSLVVAGTCVGLASVEAVNEVAFDLCIIDEASKATAMECCVPMARAKRWVLVGDSKQLPPFREEVLAQPSLRQQYDIETPEAEESMFERCRRLLPDANKVMLTIQYRMVEPIGRLISECFYEGKLTSYRTKLSKSLTQFTGCAVNWLSTRELPNRFEQGADTSFVNPCEASEIRELLLSIDQHLTATNVNQRVSVLVLSGYSAQVRILERRITQVRPQLQLLDVECCTVDRIQGREAAVVIFSITRCNRSGAAGHLRAIERTNVALSRAQNLLVIVGDDEFIESAQQAYPLRAVLDHIRKWPSECLLSRIRDGRKRYTEES